jgi:glyoxylase-like metal-dependent hydrolase (beta-lactamase superfamily II)
MVRIAREAPTVRLIRVIFPVLLLTATQLAQAQADGIEVLKVRPNFYMIAGAGGNIGVQLGADGVLLVDTGSQAGSAQVIAAVKKITDQPIRFILNTNADADHAGGNAAVSKAGQSIFPVAANANEFAKAMTNGGAASIMAPEAVLRRMSARNGNATAFPSDSWPTEAFYTERKAIYFNQEGIEILHQPFAHTDADSVIFFRRSDVIAAGDVIDTTRFPVIDVARGGSIQGEINALNKLIDLAIPAGPFIYEEGGSYVMPGHGRIYSQFDVVEYRDMMVIIRDVIQDMIKQGMTLDQIKEASPTKAYERQYGATSGSWTTNLFVESVYKSLTGKK